MGEAARPASSFRGPFPREVLLPDRQAAFLPVCRRVFRQAAFLPVRRRVYLRAVYPRALRVAFPRVRQAVCRPALLVSAYSSLLIS